MITQTLPFLFNHDSFQMILVLQKFNLLNFFFGSEFDKEVPFDVFKEVVHHDFGINQPLLWWELKYPYSCDVHKRPFK